MFDIPPHFLIPILGIVFGTTLTGVLLYPFVRAWARRIENDGAPPLSADLSQRLSRIESAVDSIAIEVERISENQRYLVKVQSDRLPSGGGGGGGSMERPR
jgi:hypothetical protein